MSPTLREKEEFKKIYETKVPYEFCESDDDYEGMYEDLD